MASNYCFEKQNYWFGYIHTWLHFWRYWVHYWVVCRIYLALFGRWFAQHRGDVHAAAEARVVNAKETAANFWGKSLGCQIQGSRLYKNRAVSQQNCELNQNKLPTWRRWSKKTVVMWAKVPAVEKDARLGTDFQAWKSNNSLSNQG